MNNFFHFRFASTFVALYENTSHCFDHKLYEDEYVVEDGERWEYDRLIAEIVDESVALILPYLFTFRLYFIIRVAFLFLNLNNIIYQLYIYKELFIETIGKRILILFLID
jgi:hypothetical protein